MSWMEKRTVPAVRPAGEPRVEPELGQALAIFRQSVHAWSEAAFNRPRTEVRMPAHTGWRLAVGWALGLVLVAGSLSGAVYERHHRQMIARQAEQARHVRQQQLAERQRATDEDLLATVDSDIARDVPAAMEPLANLMDAGSGQ
jgi:hypothetical protein